MERVTDEELARLIERMRIVSARRALVSDEYEAYWALNELRALEELRELRDREVTRRVIEDRSMDSFDFYSSGGEYELRQEEEERKRLAELKSKYEKGQD